ncbi:hypothetical protein AKJ56_02000, partial [candidate division MSBL1 archaeon SCGC-AAA382N08]
PKGFIKEWLRDSFMKVYNEVSENGRLTVPMQQFWYVMRPDFKETKERYGYKWSCNSSWDDKKPLTLKRDTFHKYVRNYEKEELGKRLIYSSERGFFIEPHSNRKVDLETESINRYDPDLEQINNLLFVEKSGFFKLIHEDAELTKKFDIGMINARGYNVIAGRDLIE